MGSTLSRPVGYAAGILYPAYMSFKALETPTADDDKQWLTYWIMHAIMQFVEYFADILISWFPFYYPGKLALLMWLMHPEFKGGALAVQ